MSIDHAVSEAPDFGHGAPGCARSGPNVRRNVSWRELGRHISYTTGMLPLWHRLRNQATLTIAMFHRVVAPGAHKIQADPRYAVHASLFASCLEFFRRHYTIIGLDDLRASLTCRAPLPSRAMLISFDDGWEDTVSVALPILRAKRVPAVVFVAADGVGQPATWWWQEVLLQALRAKRTTWEELWHMAGGGSPTTDDRDLALLLLYGSLDPASRLHLLAPFAAANPPATRYLMRPEELKTLVTNGIAIGAHGAAHLPLAMLPEPDADLTRARATLAPILGSLGQQLDALSFPHGRYNAGVIAAARATGFPILFTSDACLNATPTGHCTALLGRISIEEPEIIDPTGQLDEARLATWLFNRPIRRLQG